MQIRIYLVVVPLMLTNFLVENAAAWPGQPLQTTAATLEFVHHKPWHRGGPPWLRSWRDGGHPGKGWRYNYPRRYR